MAAGGQQEADDAVVVGSGNELDVVVQHRRDDAGGAVGGCGDDAAAGGVFLVDGEGEEVDPVHERGQRDRRSAGLGAAVRVPGSSAGAARGRSGRRGGCPPCAQPRARRRCMTAQSAAVLVGVPLRCARRSSLASIMSAMDMPSRGTFQHSSAVMKG